jgi:uncharacterized lipoprotein YehR (DUF1307 family)
MGEFKKLEQVIPNNTEFDGFKGMAPGNDDGYGNSYVKYSDAIARENLLLDAIERAILVLDNLPGISIDTIGLKYVHENIKNTQ